MVLQLCSWLSHFLTLQENDVLCLYSAKTLVNTVRKDCAQYPFLKSGNDPVGLSLVIVSSGCSVQRLHTI